MKPIPKSLLIHTAILYEVTENSWQEQQENKIAKLSRVRFEPCLKAVVTNDNRSVTLSAVLFYDIRNSAPSVAFEYGQIVEFDSEKYRIEAIEKLYDGKRLHHLEIGLCR